VFRAAATTEAARAHHIAFVDTARAALGFGSGPFARAGWSAENAGLATVVAAGDERRVEVPAMDDVTAQEEATRCRSTITEQAFRTMPEEDLIRCIDAFAHTGVGMGVESLTIATS
jgi:hypothetical protein